MQLKNLQMNAYNPHLRFDEEKLEEFAHIVEQNHGYDFTRYAKSSFRRRIERLLTLSSIRSIDDLILKLKKDGAYINDLVNEITVNTTEMFRDGSFWVYMKTLLKDVSGKNGKISIWHAGCSTGEEIYSMAIAIRELDLKDQVELIATDINEAVLEQSKLGEYPLRNLKTCEDNYKRAGGYFDFKKYCKLSGNSFQMNPELLDNVRFDVHDLVRDKYRLSCDMIMCRNVFIYFNKELQEKVIGEMTRTLKSGGYLAIGSKESIDWSQYSYKYKVESSLERVYQLR